jgi:YVTN family beta-propeller protein
MKLTPRLSWLLVILVFSWSTSYAQPRKPDSLLLVVHRTDATLGVFKAQGASLTPVKTLPTGKGPREVCVTPDGTRAYVSNKDDNSLTIVDLDTLSVAATVTDPKLQSPEGLAVSPDGKRLYAALSAQNSVLVLSTDTNKVIKEIPSGGKSPMRLLLAPDGRTLWVANDQSFSVSVIDTTTDTVVATIKVGKQPRGMALTPDKKTLLVVNVSEDTLSFVDTASREVTGPVGLGYAPQRIVLAPDGQIGYLTGRGCEALLLVDLRGGRNRSLKKRLPVGNQPNGLVPNEDGTYLYVGNDKDNTLSVIDVRLMEPVSTVPTGRFPDGMAFRK